MVLGDVCTRPCGFCAVKRGRPKAVSLDEPDRLAEACHRLGLRHVVITSVTRDDLPDGGAEHFARCVEAVRRRTGATIEVLTPDFDGRAELVDRVLEARPEVFNHNVETVARLQQEVRRKSRYDVSLSVLAHAKRSRPETFTKSGLMLGLGETIEEVIETMADLRAIGCDYLTLGQYLQPSPEHLPVVRYLPPAEFDELGRLARALGFQQVASGPFVRSSYHADEMAGNGKGQGCDSTEPRPSGSGSASEARMTAR
jgi:lipoic acid synthetase